MNVLITVIVPIYKVEPYLDRCVESIVCQTYPNLEILLVDDGSPDACPALCDAWAARDPRVRVIHKPNGGLSDARNAGLAVATGEYIGFVDSDDWVEPRMYELLYDALTDTGADIAEAERDNFGEDRPATPWQGDKPACATATAEEAISELMRDGRFRQTVWNKLYRRELLREQPFAVGKTNEDEFWTYRIFGNARKLVKLDAALYHYYCRPGSIIQSAYTLKRLDGVEATRERCEYIKERFPALYDQARRSCADNCRYHFQVLCRTEAVDPDRSHRERLLRLYRAMEKGLPKPKENLKQSLWRTLFRHAPYATAKVRNWLGIGL